MILDDVVVVDQIFMKNLILWATLVHFCETLALQKTMERLAESECSFYFFNINPYGISGTQAGSSS